MSRIKSIDKPITVSYGEVYTDIDVLHVANGTANPETVRLEDVTLAKNASAASICKVLENNGFERNGMEGYLFFDGNKVDVHRGNVFHVMPETVIEHGTVNKPDVPDNELVSVKTRNSRVVFNVIDIDGTLHECAYEFEGTVLPYRKYCAYADATAAELKGIAFVLTNDMAKAISTPITYYASIETLKPFAMSDKEFADALRKSGASDM